MKFLKLLLIGGLAFLTPYTFAMSQNPIDGIPFPEFRALVSEATDVLCVDLQKKLPKFFKNDSCDENTQLGDLFKGMEIRIMTCFDRLMESCNEEDVVVLWPFMISVLKTISGDLREYWEQATRLDFTSLEENSFPESAIDIVVGCWELDFSELLKDSMLTHSLSLLGLPHNESMGYDTKQEISLYSLRCCPYVLVERLWDNFIKEMMPLSILTSITDLGQYWDKIIHTNQILMDLCLFLRGTLITCLDRFMLDPDVLITTVFPRDFSAFLGGAHLEKCISSRI